MAHDRSLELRREALEGLAWRDLFADSLGATLRSWNRRLLNDVDLSDAERRGLVLARAELKKGVEAVYRKAALDIPAWIREEFGIFDA